MTAIESLRGSLQGHVIGPNDNGWDVARQAFNLTIDTSASSATPWAGASAGMPASWDWP